MIRYSIIIPHYNIPELLVRCIDSIPDREDIQVIVVDDNSPDSGGYLSQYVELNRDNVEVVLTHEGRGAGYARNIGLSRAKGKWLIFADADDFFTEDFANILEEYYDASEEIIYFNTRSCQCEDIAICADRTKDFMFERYSKMKDEKIFRFGYTEPWGKIISRDLIVRNNILFDETRVSNDYLFSVKTGHFAESIKIVNQPLYVYTVRQGSLASDDSQVHLDKLTARLDAYINVQAFMQSVGFKSSPALTSFILVPLFKNYNYIYRRYIQVLTRRNLSVVDLYRDTLYHYLYKFCGKRYQMGDVYSIMWKNE